ncbi:uncharacterized protein LOC131952141 [Physella acuta]|uniref:uncharacterized protein LOC131952141 n=1 Tax=Physella acuta TaxID=109671 RepID=UPI0027DAE18A|nr:uncharacterized protein LOC131952141 [Physella acuta]
MSKSEKNREKKSTAKLDRLIVLKKAIMDSLSILSRHDRSKCQLRRNNTMPNAQVSTTSAKYSSNGVIGGNSGWMPKSFVSTNNYVDVIRRPNETATGRLLMDPNSQLQSMCQTWPRDVCVGKSPESSVELCTRQYNNTETNKNCGNTQTMRSGNTETNKYCEHSSATGVNTETNKYCENTLSMKYVNTETNKYCENTPSMKCVNTETNKYCENTPSFKSNNIFDTLPQRPLQTEIVKHPPMTCKQVQTDPEVPDDGDYEHVNSDIIQYLKRIGDKSVHSNYEPDPSRHPACFSPLYDTYEERFCYRYPDHPYRYQEQHPHRIPESMHMYKSNDYRAVPPPKIRYDLGYNHAHFTQTFHERAKFNPHEARYVPNNYAESRALSDDSGSVFSSEADSDFTFYPCSKLTETFSCMTMLDTRKPGFFSPPGDLPENINTSFSWRSDLFGSSLDEVTQQFFFDEDALSDDVFLDDPVDYNKGSRSEDRFQKQAQYLPDIPQNNHYEQRHVFVPTSGLVDETGRRNSSSEDYYAYRYADIDEVLQSYEASDDTPSAFSTDQSPKPEGKSSPDDTEETPDIITDSSLSPHSQKSISSDVRSSRDENFIDQNPEFAHVFDSLRRNSTQSKARKMWRQRRARAKKNTIPVEREVESTPSHNVAGSSSRSNEATVISSKPPPKPLRGILKNKALALTSSGQSDTIKNFSVNANQTINEENSSDKQLTRECSEISLQYTENGTNSNKRHNTNRDTQNSLAEEQRTITPSSFINHQSADKSEHSDLNMENTQGQYHFVVLNTKDGPPELFTVRKNSLEDHKWTRSLHRRQKLQAKKSKMCYSTKQENENSSFPFHSTIYTSASTI